MGQDFQPNQKRLSVVEKTERQPLLSNADCSQNTSSGWGSVKLLDSLGATEKATEPFLGLF